ncbi:MAG: hypothetical protein H0U05_03090 [Actinobacteria bacterium]|nr:hypothetical protein [Actinomycetota bacterium]
MARFTHDRAIETLRATLDKDELLRHWQAGEELTPDETVAEAEATATAVALEASPS